jgi:hypothetical protein
VLTRASRQKFATITFDDENQGSVQNATPPSANRKEEVVALSAKRLSTAIELASQASSAACDESSAMLCKVGQLKVVELRDELKRLGIEGKRYSGLRKAALVALVVQVRQSQTSA